MSVFELIFTVLQILCLIITLYITVSTSIILVHVYAKSVILTQEDERFRWIGILNKGEDNEELAERFTLLCFTDCNILKPLWKEIQWFGLIPFYIFLGRIGGSFGIHFLVGYILFGVLFGIVGCELQQIHTRQTKNRDDRTYTKIGKDLVENKFTR